MNRCCRQTLLEIKPFSIERRKPISNKAMKLGGKSKDVEGFVDQLMQEGQHVASLDNSKKQTGVSTTVAAQPQAKNERYLP